MMRGVLLFNQDGTIYSGLVHTMPNGEVHTGTTHTAASKRVFYYSDLPAPSRIRALEAMVERHDNPGRTNGSFNN